MGDGKGAFLNMGSCWHCCLLVYFVAREYISRITQRLCRGGSQEGGQRTVPIKGFPVVPAANGIRSRGIPCEIPICAKLQHNLTLVSQWKNFLPLALAAWNSSWHRSCNN